MKRFPFLLFPKAATIITLCIAMVCLGLGTDLKAQNVKTLLQSGQNAESQGDYEQAIVDYYQAWYQSGALNRKKGDEALEGYMRVSKVYIANTYKNVKTLVDFDSANSVVKELQSPFQSADYKKQLEPPIATCNDLMNQFTSASFNSIKSPGPATIQQYEALLTRTGQLADSVRILFVDDTNKKKVGISTELYTAILKERNDLGCRKFSESMKNAKQGLAMKNWVKAYQFAAAAQAEGKEYGCGDGDAVTIMETCIKNGGKKMVITPFRNDNATCFRFDYNAFLGAQVNSANNPFLKVLDPQEFESLLFQKDINAEEIENLNPVSLGKLNSALDIDYMVICKFVKFREAPPALKREPAIAYAIEYYMGEGLLGDVKKYYADREKPYYKVAGSKRWDISILIKIYDVKRKAILKNETKDYFFVSEVNYYDGLDDGYEYSYKKVPQANASNILSGTDTDAQKEWRKKIGKQEFKSQIDVCQAAENFYGKELGKLILGALSQFVPTANAAK